jgi:competence/damage-inducible protein CinA-like protein
MSVNINAEIITIGTEILLGEITDTNSVYIARALRDIGVNLFFMTSVGDNEQRIASAIQIALSRADVVITCGGLGPTIDDMTRQGVALATERGLTFHQYLLDQIAARFATFHAQMTDNNRRQAYVPDNATVIENPVGTAPSFVVEYRGHIVISLPGVPREMRFLMTEKVIPYLRERYQLGEEVIKAKVLRTAGIGESLLDSQIGDELLQQSNPTVGLAAHAGQVDVRITAKANRETEAVKMITAVEAQIRERVGKYIYGIDEEKIESVLVRLLQAHSLTVAISETGIGHPISARIREVEQGDAVLVNIETYDNPDSLRQALSSEVEVPLRELAEREAHLVTHRDHASAGIAVVCRPDMGENHADSEVGSAIAVWTTEKARSRAYGFGGNSETAAEWTSTWALSMLWQMLKEKFDAG